MVGELLEAEQHRIEQVAEEADRVVDDQLDGVEDIADEGVERFRRDPQQVERGFEHLLRQRTPVAREHRFEHGERRIDRGLEGVEDRVEAGFETIDDRVDALLERLGDGIHGLGGKFHRAVDGVVQRFREAGEDVAQQPAHQAFE